MMNFAEVLEAMQIFDTKKFLEIWSKFPLRIKSSKVFLKNFKQMPFDISENASEVTFGDLQKILKVNNVSINDFCKLVPKYFKSVYDVDKQVKVDNQISYYYIYGSTDEQNGCTLKEFKDLKFYVIAEDYGGNELLFSLKNKTFHDYFHENYFKTCLENKFSYEEIISNCDNTSIANESWGIKNTNYWGAQEVRPKVGFKKLVQVLGLSADIPPLCEAHLLFNQMNNDKIDVNKWTRIVPACFESCYKDVKGQYTSYLLAGDDEQNGITEEEFGKMKFYQIAIDGWGNSLIYSCKTKMFYEYIHDDGLYFKGCLDRSIPYDQFIGSFNV